MIRYKLWTVFGILFFFVAGGLFAGTAYSQSINMEIGLVDVQRAVNECREGKEAIKKLKQEGEKYQRLADEKEKPLQELRQSLEKQGPTMKASARAAKEKELQDKYRDFQRWMDDIQSEMNQKKAEMQGKLSAEIHAVVEKLGEEGKYLFIMIKDDNVVLSSAQANDITDLVIKAYDARKK